LPPATREQVEAQRNQLQQAMREAENGIRTLARTTATNLTLAQQEIILLELKLADRQQNYAIMELRVNVGLAPAIALRGLELEIMTAQNDLLNAQQDYYLNLRRASLLVEGVAISPSGF